MKANQIKEDINKLKSEIGQSPEDSYWQMSPEILANIVKQYTGFRYLKCLKIAIHFLGNNVNENGFFKMEDLIECVNKHKEGK